MATLDYAGAERIITAAMSRTEALSEELDRLEARRKRIKEEEGRLLDRIYDAQAAQRLLVVGDVDGDGGTLGAESDQPARQA